MGGGRWTIRVARTQRPLALRARMAVTCWSRARGLLGRRALADGEALLLPGCRSIHTCGMRFPIDAVFVDAEWRVIAMKPHLVPWRVVPPVGGAWGVVELPAGCLEEAQVAVGDRLACASA